MHVHMLVFACETTGRSHLWFSSCLTFKGISFGVYGGVAVSQLPPGATLALMTALPTCKHNVSPVLGLLFG